mmetsp:Transcript_29028/g.27813  ORF Transcript_29028/g.27813 Transcript_29028/m.27813 type:complete len:368 (+) Transcript_29028:176-1279(+)
MIPVSYGSTSDEDVLHPLKSNYTSESNFIVSKRVAFTAIAVLFSLVVSALVLSQSSAAKAIENAAGLALKESDHESLASKKISHHCKAISKDLDITSDMKNFQKKTSFGHFWQNHWEPTWSCPIESRIMDISKTSIKSGGDGGKWVCDAHDIRKNSNCLVYSFGSNGDYTFDVGVRDTLGCEVHTFDPFNLGYTANLGENITTHDWGLSPTTYITDPLKKWNGKQKEMKSLFTIVKDLGHVGRKIDILKVDIDGIEFGLFDNGTFWQELKKSGIVIGQLLIELHFQIITKDTFRFRNADNNWNKPRSGKELDLMLRTITSNGWVMFHKEVNLIGSPPNDACEFSFLNLNITCPEGKQKISKNKGISI